MRALIGFLNRPSELVIPKNILKVTGHIYTVGIPSDQKGLSIAVISISLVDNVA